MLPVSVSGQRARDVFFLHCILETACFGKSTTSGVACDPSWRMNEYRFYESRPRLPCVHVEFRISPEALAILRRFLRNPVTLQLAGIWVLIPDFAGLYTTLFHPIVQRPTRQETLWKMNPRQRIWEYTLTAEWGVCLSVKFQPKLAWIWYTKGPFALLYFHN